jgi:hypothetical protein
VVITSCKIQVTKDNQSKTITLTQPGLIAQLIEDVGMDDYSKGKDTPVDSILYADTNCAPQKDKWNYRSVIYPLQRKRAVFSTHQPI